MQKRYITAAAVAIALSGSAAMAGGGVSSDSIAGSQSYSGIQNGGDRVYSSTAIAPSGNNTAPCVLHPSTGVAVLGYGVSQGTPYVDKKCLLRLEAKMLAEIATLRGMSRTAAITHLANDPDLHRTMVAIGWLQKVQR